MTKTLDAEWNEMIANRLKEIASELREFASTHYGEHKLVRLRAKTLTDIADALDELAEKQSNPKD